MADTRDLEQLKDLGSGRPAPEAVVRLYRQAFAEFGSRSWVENRGSTPVTHHRD